jgi:membrane protein YdbS with pleckstrin-like domain
MYILIQIFVIQTFKYRKLRYQSIRNDLTKVKGNIFSASLVVFETPNFKKLRPVI